MRMLYVLSVQNYLQGLLATLCALYVFYTQCVYVFSVSPTTNTAYFHKQH
jgi:hypothetical protein